MHRPDESLDGTEKNIDVQKFRYFWPKLEKIRNARGMSAKKIRKILPSFLLQFTTNWTVIN